VNAVEWLDRGAGELVAGLHRPWLDPFLVAITTLGDRLVLAAVVLAAVVLLLVRRLRRVALLLAATALAAALLTEGVKALVQRPRPDMPWRIIALPSSWSFPSGHALQSTAVYGTLALVVGRRLPARRRAAAVFALGVALPLLIAFSRVYLGVHYLSDVLAGLAGGLALVLLAGWADRRWGGSFSRDPEGSAGEERSPPGRG
jgi:undecaprenyl-diphosphatase